MSSPAASSIHSDSHTAAGETASAAASRKVPSKWRQSLFTLIGVYPIITGLLYLVLPLTAGWQIWQVTLVIAPMMVVMMVFGLIPFIQRHFGKYIMVPSRS